MSKIENKKTLSVQEAAEELGIGLTSAYERIRTGKIPSIRFGKTIKVPRAAFMAMLGEQSEAGTQISSHPNQVEIERAVLRAQIDALQARLDALEINTLNTALEAIRRTK